MNNRSNRRETKLWMPWAFEAGRSMSFLRAEFHQGSATNKGHQEAGYTGATCLNSEESLLQHRAGPYTVSSRLAADPALAHIQACPIRSATAPALLYLLHPCSRSLDRAYYRVWTEFNFI